VTAYNAGISKLKPFEKDKPLIIREGTTSYEEILKIIQKKQD